MPKTKSDSLKEPIEPSDADLEWLASKLGELEQLPDPDDVAIPTLEEPLTADLLEDLGGDVIDRVMRENEIALDCLLAELDDEPLPPLA